MILFFNIPPVIVVMTGGIFDRTEAVALRGRAREKASLFSQFAFRFGNDFFLIRSAV